ncbi:apolipoprotein N-acyltransferase [Microcoleus sp. FACHB-1515]|nr:apolipoprotein N-acyltransferase [Microcoleus sp. FACHB-1515]
MGLTPASLHLWVLAWVVLVPLWIIVVENKNQFKQSLLQGLIWGVGYHGVALSWIMGIHPMTWMGVNWWVSLAIALFCWFFVTVWGAALVALWAGTLRLATWLQPRNVGLLATLKRVLIGIAFWCILETLWSRSPLYWSSLTYTQSPSNLLILHLGQLSGPSTVAAAIIAVNGFFAEAWIHRRRFTQPINLKWICLSLAVVLFIVFHSIGLVLYRQPLIQSSQTALKVGIIQGNIPNEIKLYEAGWKQALEGYTKGYRALAAQGVDAVLTPEVALPVQWTTQNQTNNSFYQAVLSSKVVAWLGAFGRQENNLTNSLFTINANGQTISEYRKVKLVPLGEYVPFEQWLGMLIGRLSPIADSLAAGQPNQRFDTPFGRAIVGICYESAFSEHFRAQALAGGQFILTASNNAHYSQAMPAQHHAQDVMRAIEVDRWAVRATNTGYSGIVDPHGRTLWQSKLNTYAIYADTVYRRQSRTLYVQWGDWLTPFLGLIGLAILLLNFKQCFSFYS